MSNNQTINCQTAQQWMDKRSLSNVEDELFHSHLNSCHNCALEADIEPLLRDVIAPDSLPTVSSHFEAQLMQRLGLQHSPVYLFNPKSSFQMRWDWIAILIATSVVVLPIIGNWKFIWKMVTVLFNAGVSVISNTDYYVSSFIDSLPSIPSLDMAIPLSNPSLTIPILLISVVLMSGAMLIGTVIKK